MKHMPRQNTWIHLRIALLLVAAAVPSAYAQTPGTLTISAHPQQMSCELMTESVERSAGFLAAGASLSEAYQRTTGQNASLREQVSNIHFTYPWLLNWPSTIQRGGKRPWRSCAKDIIRRT